MNEKYNLIDDLEENQEEVMWFPGGIKIVDSHDPTRGVRTITASWEIEYTREITDEMVADGNLDFLDHTISQTIYDLKKAVYAKARDVARTSDVIEWHIQPEIETFHIGGVSAPKDPE
jgi:hypothetical protein